MLFVQEILVRSSTLFSFSSVYLREDAITDGNCRDEVMKNAKKTEEEYYVAPPGRFNPLTAKTTCIFR